MGSEIEKTNIAVKICGKIIGFVTECNFFQTSEKIDFSLKLDNKQIQTLKNKLKETGAKTEENE